jgi:hypothetical protein
VTARAINENSGANQLVYTATSSDTADMSTGSTVYSLKVGSDTALMLDAATGAVRLKANPDFEAKSSYVFTVVATDAAGNASEKTVTLAILDLNENSLLPSWVPANPAPAVGASAAEWDAWTQKYLGPDSVFAHQWDNIDPTTIPGPMSVSSPAYADAVALGNAAGAAYASAVGATVSASLAANTAGASPKSSIPILGAPAHGLQQPALQGISQALEAGGSLLGTGVAVKSVASAALSIPVNIASAESVASVFMPAAIAAAPNTLAPSGVAPDSSMALSRSDADALVLVMSKGDPAPASPLAVENAESGDADRSNGNPGGMMGRLGSAFLVLVDLYTRISSRSVASPSFQVSRPNTDADAQAQSSDEYV